MVLQQSQPSLLWAHIFLSAENILAARSGSAFSKRDHRNYCFIKYRYLGKEHRPPGGKRDHAPGFARPLGGRAKHE